MLRLRPTGYAQHERELKSYEGLPFALSPSPSSGQATRSEVEGRRHLFSLHFKQDSYIFHGQPSPRLHPGYETKNERVSLRVCVVAAGATGRLPGFNASIRCLRVAAKSDCSVLRP